MQGVGAAWLMTSLTRNPLYIALIQTASALPFFLLALPAGSIGDIFDRRKLILGTETWMLVIAVVLTVTTFAGVMTPSLLLVLTLGLSIGDAVESPTWSAIFPELVDKDELPAALALNGIEFNLARGRRSGHWGVRCRCGRRRSGICIQCLLLPRCHRRGQKMEEACTKEYIARRDLPGSNLRCHSLCAVFPRYPHAAASVRRSYLFHQFLLGAPAHGGERTQQESNRLRILAGVRRLRRGAGRHGAAADQVEALDGDSTVFRHSDVRRNCLKPGLVAYACDPLFPYALWRF